MDKTFTLHVSYLNNDNNLSQAEEITLDETTTSYAQLLSKIGEAFGVPSDDFDLYRGLQCLGCMPDQDPRDVGIRSGCRLQAIQKKLLAPQKESESVDFSLVQNAANGLRTMFNSSRHLRQRGNPKITAILEDSEAMDSIIESVDGLAEDRTALGILENVKLFEVMLGSKNLKKIVNEHPCLARAFVEIWNLLVRLSNPSNFDLVAGTSSSESQESMDVDNHRFLTPSFASQRSSSSQSGRGIITSSQLASAIAQASSPGGGAAFPYSAYNTPASSNAQSPMPNSAQSATTTPTAAGNLAQPPSQVITPDVFSQAMQQALMSTRLQPVTENLQSDTASGVAPALGEDAMQAGLDQLRAMGIGDDAASRQALTATQGNVEAAINLLFSGT